MRVFCRTNWIHEKITLRFVAERARGQIAKTSLPAPPLHMEGSIPEVSGL